MSDKPRSEGSKTLWSRNLREPTTFTVSSLPHPCLTRNKDKVPISVDVLEKPMEPLKGRSNVRHPRRSDTPDVGQRSWGPPRHKPGVCRNDHRNTRNHGILGSLRHGWSVPSVEIGSDLHPGPDQGPREIRRRGRCSHDPVSCPRFVKSRRLCRTRHKEFFLRSLTTRVFCQVFILNPPI